MDIPLLSGDAMSEILDCMEKDLPPGTKRNVEMMGRTILLVNVNGKIFAMDGICYDDGANLADGLLDGYTIRCPIGGTEYDVRTGEPIKGSWAGRSSGLSLRTYQVVLEEGCIKIEWE